MTRLGGYAGILAPPLIGITLVALTLAERGFLRQAGWSPIKRTPVEWPSVLLLSHVGWVEAVTFVAAGLMTVALAGALVRVAPTRTARLGGGLLVLGGVSLCFVASTPDRVGETTWSGQLHDGAYVVLVVSALAAASLLAVGLRRPRPWRRLSRVSVLAVGAIAVTAAITNVDAIAQFGRYFLLGSMLLWLELVAISVVTTTRR